LSGYEPRFDLDYRRGLVGEHLVGSFLEALSGTRIEVKTDYGAYRTGNLYVESHQTTKDGGWKPSGINISESEWYCFAGPGGVGFIAIRKEALLELAQASPRSETKVHNAQTRATKGRLVKLTDIIAKIFTKE
jgi:hypothetical protein